jgi:hypothetical protein
VWRRDPRYGDPIKIPDGDQIDAVLPMVGRDEGIRPGSVSAAIEDKPVGDDVNKQPVHYWR